MISCWLVDPALRTVTVYASTTDWATFSGNEVIDEQIGINLALDAIFD